jgi:hypothetical protein
MTLLDVEDVLNAVSWDHTAHIIAGDTPKGVTGRSGSKQYPRINTCCKQSHHDRLTTEREDTTCQEGRDEHTPRAITNQYFRKVFHTYNPREAIQKTNNATRYMFFARPSSPTNMVAPMSDAYSKIHGESIE